MLNFKDLLQQDLNNVFLNANEFAEKHTINGIEADIIFDDEELKELAADKQQEGLYVNKKLIKISEAKLEEIFSGIPAIGSPIKLDRKTYRVFHSSCEDGLATLILEANRV